MSTTDRFALADELPSARLLEEITALRGIFGEDSVTVSTDNDMQQTVSVAFQNDSFLEEDLRCDFRLPPEYPGNGFPTVSVASSTLTRENLSVVLEKMNEILAETRTRGPRECLFDVLEVLPETMRQLHESLECQVSNSKPETVLEVSLIYIDHMNEPKTYIDNIKRWLKGINADVHIFLRLENNRAKDVVLVVCASPISLQAFRKRLRTEYVDVNARGRKCKERQLETLGTFPATASRIQGGLRGKFEVVSYTSTEELHQQLSVLQVLDMWLVATGVQDKVAGQ